MLFQASRVAAPARIAARVDGHVPEFAGHAHEPVENSPAGDDAAADAGPERQQDQVVDVTSRAEPLLALRRGVGVVFQNHGRAELVADFVPNRETVELRQVVRTDDQALLNLDKPRYCHADSSQRLVSKLITKGANPEDDIFDDGIAALAQVRLAAHFAEQFAVAVDRRGTEIGTSQVDPDGIGGLHGHEAAS